MATRVTNTMPSITKVLPLTTERRPHNRAVKAVLFPGDQRGAGGGLRDGAGPDEELELSAGTLRGPGEGPDEEAELRSAGTLWSLSYAS